MSKYTYKIAILCLLLFTTMSACSKEKPEENEPQIAVGGYYSVFFYKLTKKLFL